MQTLHPDLFPESLLVEADHEQAFTTSRKIAEHFRKQHKHVLRDIERLSSDLAEAENWRPSFGPPNENWQSNFGSPNSPGPEFWRLNFEPSDYVDSRGKTQPMYRIGHDGFALLAMGFTGREALAWKLRFLAAFREMETRLAKQTRREASALFKLRPRWQPIVLHPGYKRQQLLPLTGHRSAGSITACRRRMREVGVLA
jgi:Rha family phage regulatory protein